MRRLTIAMSAFAILALCVVTVMAEPRKERRGFGPPRDPEKAREHFELLTMWKMMEALDLDKSTGEKIFEIRRRFTAEKKTIDKELRQDLDTLRTRLQDEPTKLDDTELAGLITAVRDKRKRLENLQDQQYDEISKVLNVRQQAQLLVFMKDFQAQIRMFLHPPPPPPGHPPPPGGPPPPGPGPGAGPFTGSEEF